MQIKWVKKEINKGERQYYNNSSYCSLGNDYIGFLIVGDIPEDCELCDINDLRQIDIYRRSANIRPFPLEEVKNQESFIDVEEKEEIAREFKKIKEELRNVFTK